MNISVMGTITSKVKPVSVNDVQTLLLSFESRLKSLATLTANVDGSLPSLTNVTQSPQRRQNTTTQSQRARAPFSEQYPRGGRGFGRGFYGGK